MYNGIFYGVFVLSVYKSCAGESMSDRTLTIVGAIGSICNGSSRIAWSAVQDKYGFNRIYLIVLVIQLISAIFIYRVRDLTIPYSICVALAFVTDGATFSMFPAAAAQIFGIANGGQILTIMLFAVPFSSLTGYGLIKMDSISE